MEQFRGWNIYGEPRVFEVCLKATALTVLALFPTQLSSSLATRKLPSMLLYSFSLSCDINFLCTSSLGAKYIRLQHFLFVLFYHFLFGYPYLHFLYISFSSKTYSLLDVKQGNSVAISAATWKWYDCPLVFSHHLVTVLTPIEIMSINMNFKIYYIYIRRRW